MTNSCRQWRLCLLTALSLTVVLPLRGAAAAPPARPATAAGSVTSQSTTVLYDGALGTLPGMQGFVYLTNPLFGALATQSVSGGATTLDTTPRMSDSAGYFANSALYPALDRTAGYSLLFTTQVMTESHVGNDRAGFSVIILSSDLMGIELGFWTNEVWAQEGGSPPGLFTHAEGAAFNTTSGLITYTLTITGSTYALSASSGAVLSGGLRDYTAFTGSPNPYETPNLIFLGDDTSSAQAKIKLSAVRLSVPIFTVYLPLIAK